MNKEERIILEQWIEKAEHDLISVKILIDHSPIVLDIACFHCQQSIEKYLKTFLIFNDCEFEKTHNLSYLIQECSTIDPEFSALDFKDLNVYAVRGRYPHDFVSPELSEAKEYYQMALDVKQLVLSKIKF